MGCVSGRAGGGTQVSRIRQGPLPPALDVRIKSYVPPTCAGHGAPFLSQDVCVQSGSYASDPLKVLSSLGFLEIRVLVSLLVSFK